MVESFENLDTVLRDWGKIRYKKSLVEALNRYESLEKKEKAFCSLGNDSKNSRAVTDHRRRQNMVGTSVIHSAIAACATFLFLPHFDVICDLLVNRRTTTWNLFVNYNC